MNSLPKYGWKQRKNSLFKTTIAAAILISLLLSPSGHGRIIERIVAIVNDRVVLLSDAETFRKKLVNEGLVDDAFLQMYDREKLKKDSKALIEYLIDERIVDSEIKKSNLEVTFERVEQEIRTILKSRQINRNQLKEVLAGKGASMAEYQAFIKSSIERQSVIEREVSARIKISDEDIAAHFTRTRGPKQNQVFEYSLAHILFRPKNGGDAGAKARAEAALKKISQDQPFDRYAEQFSEDPNFSQGGFLGTFRSGEMSKEMESAIQKLNEGQLAGPVKTKAGYHILKILKKTVSADPELAEKKEQIRSVLFAEAFKRQFRTWLDQKRDSAFIRVNADPDAVTR
jgi:peptidyl-prolyl cis-trans isomerase SurA